MTHVGTDTETRLLAQNAQALLQLHEYRIDQMSRDIEVIKENQAKILEILAEARGSWKTLVMIGGICSAAGAVISWCLQHITFSKG